jgi:N-formylglutamate amidohydrolase
MPHTGTHVPEPLLGRMTKDARLLPDTDWHLERLYDFLDELGARCSSRRIRATSSTSTRPPDNANLYPGCGHHPARADRHVPQEAAVLARPGTRHGRDRGAGASALSLITPSFT